MSASLQYDQEFQDKTIILFILAEKTNDKIEIFNNFQERNNNYRNIVLSRSRASLTANIEQEMLQRYEFRILILKITNENKWNTKIIYQYFSTLTFYLQLQKPPPTQKSKTSQQPHRPKSIKLPLKNIRSEPRRKLLHQRLVSIHIYPRRTTHRGYRSLLSLSLAPSFLQTSLPTRTYNRRDTFRAL